MYTPLEVKARARAGSSAHSGPVARTKKHILIISLESIHHADSHSLYSEGWARSSGHATRRYATMDTSVAAAAIIVIHTPTR